VLLTGVTNSWLFTEILFAESLLRDELVLLIKVFKVYEIGNKNIRSKQKINPKSVEPMKLSFLKSFSIVNLSDAFFDNRMKDGKPLRSLRGKTLQLRCQIIFGF